MLDGALLIFLLVKEVLILLNFGYVFPHLFSLSLVILSRMLSFYTSNRTPNFLSGGSW